MTALNCKSWPPRRPRPSSVPDCPGLAALWSSRLVATAAEDRLSVGRTRRLRQRRLPSNPRFMSARPRWGDISRPKCHNGRQFPISKSGAGKSLVSCPKKIFGLSRSGNNDQMMSVHDQREGQSEMVIPGEGVQVLTELTAN